MSAFCLGLGLLLSWGAHAHPMRPLGTDGATLNVPSQYATIQTAIDAAETGDTIRVAPGRYNEHIRVENKDVTILGTGGAAQSVIETAGNAAISLFNGGGDLSGFTLTTIPGQTGLGINVNEGHRPFRIHDCVFDGIHGPSGAGAAILTINSIATIDRNLFRGVSQGGDTQFGAGVITIESGAVTVVNNVFEHNGTRAVNLYGAGGFELNTIANNTIIDNAGGLYFYSGVDPLIVVRNNIVVGNQIGLESDPGSNTVLRGFENNLVYGNVITTRYVVDPIGTGGNIAGQPMFVDQTHGDYHLQADSPAIDRGSSAYPLAEDYEGMPRPVDGNGDGVANLDLGAFEAPATSTFDLSLQDDETGALLLIDSTSGRFRYARCGANSIVLDGIGTVRVVNDCKVRFKLRGAVTIDATIRPCQFNGKAHVKAKALSINDRLVDSDTANNIGLCS